MAIVKCPGCGNDVSDYSHECPKCGEIIKFKIKKRRVNLEKEIKSYLISTILLSIMAISAGIVYIFTAETYDFKLEIVLFANFLIFTYTIKALVLLVKENKSRYLH